MTFVMPGLIARQSPGVARQKVDGSGDGDQSDNRLSHHQIGYHSVPA